MKSQDKTIANTAIIAGLILIIAISALLVLKPVTYNNTINVQGIAEVKATPDLVVVYYYIETKGETLTEAKDANALIYKNLVSELVIAGFESKELKTESFNVYENIIWDNGGQTSDGYKASHSLKLEIPIEDLHLLDVAIDSAVKSGSAISYINFELTQASQNTYKSEAIKLASADATTKAGALAEGFDKDLGKLISVSINDFGYYPWNVYSSPELRMDSMDGAAVKSSMAAINPSEQSISASVSATFKIK